MVSRFATIATNVRPQIGSAIRFVFAFTAAKAFAFFGPIVLSQLMAPNEYGAIELALSVGLLIANIASLGVPAATPQLYLIKEEPQINDLLLLYVLQLAAAATAIGAGAYFLRFSATNILVCTVPAFFGAQLAASIYCRTMSHRMLSGWADNLTLTLVTLLAIAQLAIGGSIQIGGLATLALLGAILVAVTAAALLSAVRRDGIIAEYRRVIGIGFFMMVNSLFMWLITSSMRVLVGYWLALSDVGTYSLCARVNLYMLLVYQSVTTGLYSRLYAATAKTYDRFSAGLVVMLSLVGLIGSVAFRLFIGRILLQTGYDIPRLRILFPIVAVQTILWIVTALLEMPINREQISSRSVAAMMAALALFVAAAATLHSETLLTLENLCMLFNLLLIIAVSCQLLLLWYHGFKLRLTALVAPFSLLPLLAESIG